MFYRMPENDVNTLSSKLSKFSSLGSKHRYRLVICVCTVTLRERGGGVFKFPSTEHICIQIVIISAMRY